MTSVMGASPTPMDTPPEPVAPTQGERPVVPLVFGTAAMSVVGRG